MTYLPLHYLQAKLSKCMAFCSVLLLLILMRPSVQQEGDINYLSGLQLHFCGLLAVYHQQSCLTSLILEAIGNWESGVSLQHE